jgi:hypothetical protein
MEQEPLIPEVVVVKPAPNNGNGRPAGARSVRTRTLERAVRSDILPIIQKVITLAKDGDMIAAKLILDRVWPRPRMGPSMIDLPATRTPAEIRAAMHQLLARVTRGEVSPDEGAAIVSIMRDVLDSHRVQTFDAPGAVEVRATTARELLEQRLARQIAERKQITAPENGAGETAG